MDHTHNDETLRILAPKGHPLTRRKFISMAAAVGAGVLAAGSPAGAASTMSAMETVAKNSLKTAGKPSKSLYLYTWGQYDNPTTFSAWQKGTGIAIQIGSYDSNEAMIAKLELAKGTAGYDIVVPTGGYIPEMAAKGLLLPLTKSLIPNFKNLDPALLNFPWDRGNKYSIPKDFGTTGFIYDKTLITRKMETWQDFVTAAALPQVSGRVSILDDPNDVLAIALWNEGVD
jgi:spermidine/putrescine transport system substrate-binding protein